LTPFDGIRVLDCAQNLAGQMAAMLLADFGAEVLKLDPPGGDAARRRPGYVAWNRNKRRATLDQVADRAGFEALLDGADVAVFDQGPTRFAELGLDSRELTATRPQLTHLWLPPYGVAGRWSDLPAHHATLTGLTGTAFRQGAYADQPVWHATPLVHYAQAVLGASAAGAALLQRTHTGRGRAAVVTGLNAMAQIHCPVVFAGAPPAPRGAPFGTSPGHRLYRCGDGQWLFLGCLLPPFYRKALSALGLAGGDPAEATAAIQARLGTEPRDHWVSFFRAHDVPVGLVGRREDWLDSEIIQANELAAALVDPALGRVRMAGLGARLEATPGSVRHLMQDATGDEVRAFAAPRPTRTPAPAPTDPAKPLAGVRVLDLGTLIAGPHAATILANFGADVVKIEPAEGDSLRPTTGLFINYNRGKRGLGLDLKHPEGRQLFLDLARRADVVIDNFRPGVRERLGIDYATLRAINPRIISCSSNTYGARGVDARLPGFDSVLQARSGLMAAQGGQGGEPVYHVMPVNDVATAALTGFAIVAALNAREITGEGQNLETSLAASSATYQFGELAWFEGRAPNPEGARDCLGFSALDRYYACQNGWLTLAIVDAAQFEALARVLGREDWTNRFAGGAALAEPRDGALAKEIEGSLAALGRDEAVDRLSTAGVPVAPVLRDEEAHRDTFLHENGYFERHTDPRVGELTASRGFAEFVGSPAGFQRLQPGLGEHNREVLAEYGVDAARITALAEDGAIFPPPAV